MFPSRTSATVSERGSAQTPLPYVFMDEYDLALCRAQSVIYALTAGRPAEDGPSGRIGGEQGADARLVLGRAGDEHLVRIGRECAEAVTQHRKPVQLAQDFVLRKSRTDALACRAENGGDHAITS